MKSVCLDIAKDASVDPGSLSVNRIDLNRADINLFDVYSLISKKYQGNTPTDVTKFTDLLVHKERSPQAVAVDIDYTANGASGKVRSKAACTFLFEALPKPLLIAVAVNGNSFSVERVDDLFKAVKRPDGLDQFYYLR